MPAPDTGEDGREIEDIAGRKDVLMKDDVHHMIETLNNITMVLK